MKGSSRENPWKKKRQEEGGRKEKTKKYVSSNSSIESRAKRGKGRSERKGKV